ncbi:MAG: 50S ribosomal protein L30e [Thermoplasmata archaeon]|nr:MAG: 50S ribosomal protein L30e [Thermoplasmata archaeon]RLF45767.1 MAG: 50S ribosomal protein L30e [Thermoplasmata archaeon]HDD57739.1 50S ribosomal protein L30e [Thermoplasmatales archaeon]
MVDVERAMKSVMKEGKVVIGIKETREALNKGKAKMVVFAKNCPFKEELLKILKEKGIGFYEYQGMGIDLGYACGKPFAISTFAVIDAGNSNILKLVK